MDTPTIRTGHRFRASTILVVLALTIAVSVLAIQARSIFSSAPVVRPVTAQIDPHPVKDDMHPYWLHWGPGGRPIDRPSLAEIEARKLG